MLSRRDILKVSAVSAAAAGVMGAMIKSASADEHRNIVPPSSFQPAADAQSLFDILPALYNKDPYSVQTLA